MSFPSINIGSLSGAPVQAGDWSPAISSESAGHDFESALLSTRSGRAPSGKAVQSPVHPDSVATAIPVVEKETQSGRILSETQVSEEKTDQSRGRSSKSRVLASGSQVQSVAQMPVDSVLSDEGALPPPPDFSSRIDSAHLRVENDREAVPSGTITEDQRPLSGETDRPVLMRRVAGNTGEDNSRVNYPPEVRGRVQDRVIDTGQERLPGPEVSSFRKNRTAHSVGIKTEMRPVGSAVEDQRSGQSDGDKPESTGFKAERDELKMSGGDHSHRREGQSEIQKSSGLISRETPVPNPGRQKVSLNEKSGEELNAKVILGGNSSSGIQDKVIRTDEDRESLLLDSGAPVKANTGSQIVPDSGISTDQINEDKPAFRWISRTSEQPVGSSAETFNFPQSEIRSRGADRQGSGDAGELEAETIFRRPSGEVHMRNVPDQGTGTGSEDGRRITSEHRMESPAKGAHGHSGELPASRQVPRNPQNPDYDISGPAPKSHTNGEGIKNAAPGLVGSGRHLLPHHIIEQNLPESGNAGENGQKNIPAGKLVQIPQYEVAGKIGFSPASLKSEEFSTPERMGTNSAQESEMVDRSAKYANGQTESGSMKVGPEYVGTIQDVPGQDLAVLMNDQSSSNGNEFSAWHENRGGNELPTEGSMSDGDEGQLEAVASRPTETVRGTSQSKGQDLTRVEQLSEILIKEVVRLRPLANGEMKMKIQLAEGELEMTLVQKGEWVEARLGRESQESLQLTSQIGQMNESLARHLIRVTPSENSGANSIPTQSDSRQGTDDSAHDFNQQARHNSEHPRQDRQFSGRPGNPSELPAYSDNQVADISPQKEPQHIGQIDLVA